MENEKNIREYKNKDFKINCIYDEKGKTVCKIIEDAFKNYYELKTNV